MSEVETPWAGLARLEAALAQAEASRDTALREANRFLRQIGELTEERDALMDAFNDQAAENERLKTYVKRLRAELFRARDGIDPEITARHEGGPEGLKKGEGT